MSTIEGSEKNNKNRRKNKAMDPSSGLGPSSNKDADKSVVFEAIQNIGSLEADVNSTGALTPSEEMTPDAAFMARVAAKRRSRIIRFSAIGLVVVIGLVVMLLKGVSNSSQDLANARTDAAQRFGNTSIPLAKISGGGSLSVENNQVLSINGQLNVNNSLVLAPTKQPNGAVTGQLYYDQSSNQLSFYNGKQFVKVVSGNLPTPTPGTSIDGSTGSLSTGSGIALAGNQLSNTGVLTLQGETGNVTLTAGNGILVNGTTLSNSGLLSLGGQTGDITVNPNGLSVSGGTLKNTGIISAVGAGTITVTNDGNGNIIIDGPGSGSGGGTVASLGGTIGKIAKFTGVQTIADSLLSDDGTTVTVGGALHVTGAITLDTPLAVTSGGTGANSAAGARTNLGAAASGTNTDITSLTGLTTALSVTQGGTGIGTLATNGVIIGNGTSPLSSVVAGTSGLCLMSTAGAPTWQTCAGAGGVASVDGLTGALTLANSSGSAGTITINDASAAAKGIASFNATNFLVSSGAVNTIQNIAVTSSPTFAGLTLSSPLAVSSGGTGKSSLTANGVLVGNGTSAVTSATGSTGQCLVVSAGGSPTFATCPGSGGVTSVNAATGAITIQGTAGSSVSTVGGTITINDASSSVKGLASFNGTNFTVSGGAVNTIQDIATTSAPQFGQLSIVSNQATGKMLTINNTNAAATGNLLDLQVGGSNKLSVAPSGNLTTSGTISSGAINGQTIGSSAAFTGTLSVAGALSVNAITPTGALTVGVSGQSFTLQGNASSTLTATSGVNTTTVSFQSPTASVNYRFAATSAGNYDICTTAGNCAGVGGGVTTPGGTANTLAKFTGSGAIGNSIITDNGSTVTIGGTLSVNTITPTSPLTVGATSQNLTLQGAAVTLSATSAGITNSLVFAAPSGSNKTITLPNASGTVAVSASGPLSIDANGNLTCPTCLTGGGGGGSGVSSVNGLTGAVVLQGTDSQTFSMAGSTISVHDATSAIKGVASFNATNLTVTAGKVNTVQDIAVTSTPTFAGLNLTSALTVTNGGTGATTAAGARTNLGAAASGANADITSLSGLTTALSIVQGGTGVSSLAANGILIGNGTSAVTTATGTNGQCLVIVSGAPVFTTCPGAGGSYVNLQGSTPGTQQTGHFNISGTGMAGVLQGTSHVYTPDLDTVSAGTLTIGGTNATTVNIANNALVHTVNVGTSATAAQAVTIGSTNSSSALLLQGGSNSVNLSALGLTFNGSSTGIGFDINGGLVGGISGSDGTLYLQNSMGDSHNAFVVKSQDGNTWALTVDTISNSVSTGVAGKLIVGTGGIQDAGALNFSGTTMSTYTTPAGASVSTKISIPSFDPGSFNQLIAIGLPNGAQSTARAISVFDDRAAGNNQPALAVFNPAENNLVGFSWDGSNSLAKVKTTGGDLMLSPNNVAALTTFSNGAVGIGGAAAGASSQNQVLVVQGGGYSTQSNANGQNSSDVLDVYGSKGQETINAGFSSGNGSGIILQAGNGGNAVAGSTNGSGGNVTISAGAAGTGGTGGAAGSVIVKNQSNSLTAFQVQNALGNSILNVDTVNGQAILGAATANTGALKFYTTGSSFGVILTSAAETVGNATITIPNTAGVNDTICLQTLANCGGGAAGVNTIGALDGGTANANGATITGTTLYLQSASYTNPGLVNTTTQTFAGDKTFKSTTNSSTAFQIQNAGSQGILNVDTSNKQVTIGYGATSSLSINTANSLGSLTVQDDGTNGVPNLFLRGTASKTTDFFDIQDNANFPILSIGATGATTFKNSVNSTAAFRVQNATGSSILNVDTTGGGTTTVNGLLDSKGSIYIDGTNTTSNNNRLYVAGTLNSSYTGNSNYGLQLATNFNPSSGTISSIYGIASNPNLNGSSNSINQIMGVTAGVQTSAGYTGTVANGTDFNASDVSIGGSTTNFTTFTQYNASAISGNTGNTSGTVGNMQLYLQGSTAAAGAGGTLNNYGARITMSSGSGAGTTSNYGIYISGNGGTGGTGLTTNYAIYSASTAYSLLSGTLEAASLISTGNATIGTSAGSGAVFMNNGATVNSTLALGNFSGGGSIGTAATTVDKYTSISVAETTGNQTLTLPNPTSSAVYGRVLYISNVGTADFTLSGTPINKLGLPLKAGSTATLIWSNTNGGASWLYAGADGNGILNQNTTTQTANFIINGTGKAQTFQASTFNSTGNLTVDAGSGSTLTLGSSNSATISIGSDTNNAHTINIGNTAGSNAQTITIGNNATSTSTTTVQGANGVVLQANGATVGVAVKSVTNSTVAFQVQNSSSVGIFTVDTSTSTITLGSVASGNYISITSGGLTAFGSAQHTQVIGLNAEYAGAVLDAQSDASCSSANNGTMTSHYDSIGDMNYYNWAGGAAAQCYDVVARITLPNDFSSWASNTPLTLQTFTTDTAVGLVDIALKDTAHTTVTGCSYVSATPAATNTWTTAGSNCNLSTGTYTAGQTITIRIRMTADASNTVRIGDLSLSYKSKF